MSKELKADKTKKLILRLLDEGHTDAQEIYTAVVQEYGYPRPSVRRDARALRLELQRKVDILNGGLK